ncbi:hypothetical protein FDECE_10953 [Fusarium decemcellulare]|nr:hypothetical protein FDECE_10953 [Fusarium decemcellulare]
MSSSSMTTCWTCRLRKKKCDKKKPVCGVCHTLGITCDQSTARPSWLGDDHERQKLARQIKIEIKQKAELRRERDYVNVLTLQNATLVEDAAPLTATHALIHTQETLSENARSSQGAIFPGEPGCDSEESPDGMELELQITYLDQVFPFFFPFYHPSIVDGGRTWVLASLRGSTPLSHTAMSLSTYFIALVLGHKDDDQQGDCTRTMWDKLASHLDAAIKAMQQAMGQLNVDEAGSSISQWTCLMEGVVQLLVFGTGMAKTTDGHIHIAAAASLFRQIIDVYGTKDATPDLQLVLGIMNKPSLGFVASNYRTWNNEQCAFRFFVAVLLFVDIIASTVLGDTPQLYSYHPFLIHDGTDLQESEGLLRMEDFVGCPGWVLLLIADSTAIGAQRQRGELGHFEIIEKCTYISKRLETGMVELRADSNAVGSSNDLLIPHFNLAPGPAERNRHSLIWAHAVQLYHFITASGWCEQHQSVRANVSIILSLLRQVSSVAVLRNLSWPFCVAGCLATQDEENAFREIADVMGELRSFGTTSEALKIMEQIWKMRGQIDLATWNFTRCFSIFGSFPLLV